MALVRGITKVIVSQHGIIFAVRTKNIKAFYIHSANTPFNSHPDYSASGDRLPLL